MRDEVDNTWAYYDSFSVGPAADKYRLSVSCYDPSSPAGDSLSDHDGMQWSAPDQDNDLSPGSCAGILDTSWWFNVCYQANPLGTYSVHK